MREGKFNKSVFAPSVSQNNCVFSCFFFFPGVIKIYIFLRLIVRNVSEFDTETSLLHNQKHILKCTQTKKKRSLPSPIWLKEVFDLLGVIQLLQPLTEINISRYDAKKYFLKWKNTTYDKFDCFYRCPFKFVVLFVKLTAQTSFTVPRTSIDWNF